MEHLPIEVLQQIAWYSLNPEIYLVSKALTSKLPPLHLFERDVAALLICERVTPKCSWNSIEAFPWQTYYAADTDFRLTQQEWAKLRHQTRSCFTGKKLMRTSSQLCKIWVNHLWGWDASLSKRIKALYQYFDSEDFKHMAFRISDKYGRELWSHDWGRIFIREGARPDVGKDGQSRLELQVFFYYESASFRT